MKLEPGEYRHNVPGAAFNPWNMPDPTHQAAKRRRQRVIGTCVAVFCSLMPACDHPAPVVNSPDNPPTKPVPELAAARIDLAKARLSAGAPDEALALLVSSLEADLGSDEARVMAGEIIRKTRWHLPETTIAHRRPVERLDFAPPSSLWVSLSGETNTTVRWNTESLLIESVLFPIKTPETRSLVFDPTRRSMVVERAGVTLLCNAQTLKPIRELGPLPECVTPSSVIVFSADGLLLAHPATAAPDDPSLVWHLRDANSGEVIRKSDPVAPDPPRPLTAFLDRRALRILHADGSLLELPVSPVENIRSTPPAEAITLLHAQFVEKGGSALTLKLPGPHRIPELSVISMGGQADRSPDPFSLLERFPWSRHPGLPTGLLRDPANAPLKFDEPSTLILTRSHAPIRADSDITAVALSGDQVIVGEKNGLVTFHRTLPFPCARPDASKPPSPDSKSLAALHHLTICLAGVRYEETHRSFVRSGIEQRLQAFKDCDFDQLTRILPALDFSPVAAAIQTLKPRSAAPEALVPLWDRLARADPTGASWPVLLEESKDLTENPWHQQLAAAVVSRASKNPVNHDPSPWLAPLEIEKTFEQGDAEAIMAAIQAIGGKGHAAAKALELALASTHPEWIDACLTHAADLPPLLRMLAVSRIAWLQDRKADTLAGWPDVFPDLKRIRLCEDWDGWEQADFSPALEKLRLCMNEELAAISVPENPTPEQRKALAARLSDPATLKSVGRARFAQACLKAALSFAAFKDEKETTFSLAARARDLGEAPAPCLRAEAIALTSLGDYQKAHDRWIMLITDFPVDTHLPGDYAEAAYTAFENANPQQAMAILTNGLHRFPNDANFALRAGWVALLTGNAERAYRFLLTGRQIGYPPEKLENATALLAIAAAQTGIAEDAAAFYQDLILLDPAWKNPETIESLEWPKELKASLWPLAQ